MSTWLGRSGTNIPAMNGQAAIKPMNEARLIAKMAQAIVTIICLAFMLDCLADEQWPS